MKLSDKLTPRQIEVMNEILDVVRENEDHKFRTSDVIDLANAIINGQTQPVTLRSKKGNDLTLNTPEAVSNTAFSEIGDCCATRVYYNLRTGLSERDFKLYSLGLKLKYISLADEKHGLMQINQVANRINIEAFEATGWQRIEYVNSNTNRNMVTLIQTV